MVSGSGSGLLWFLHFIMREKVNFGYMSAMETTEMNHHNAHNSSIKVGRSIIYVQIHLDVIFKHEIVACIIQKRPKLIIS